MNNSTRVDDVTWIHDCLLVTGSALMLYDPLLFVLCLHLICKLLFSLDAPLRAKSPPPYNRNKTLTNSHKNIADIESGLGGCFHEEEPVFISVFLRLLKTKRRRRQLKGRRKRRMLGCTAPPSSYLMLHRSLVRNVRLVAGQSDHNVGVGLSLQLLHPVFGAHKRVLRRLFSSFVCVICQWFKKNTIKF